VANDIYGNFYMSSTVLSILRMQTLGLQHYDSDPHFTDEETETVKLSGLFKGIEIERGTRF
jgi:hypothetical protein